MADKLTRCSRYLAAMPDSVQRECGDEALYEACCATYRFGLTEEEAFDLIQREYNIPKRCKPLWPASTIKEKLDSIHRHWPEERFGEKLKDSPPEASRSSTPRLFVQRQRPASEAKKTQRPRILDEKVPKIRVASGMKNTRYDYKTADGHEYIRIRRMEQPDGNKHIFQFHWDEKLGDYTPGIPRDWSQIPYRMSDFKNAAIILWVEGEKKADALHACIQNILAMPVSERGEAARNQVPFLAKLLTDSHITPADICVSTGTSGSNCRIGDMKDCFAGKHVIMLPDNDEPGYNYADTFQQRQASAGAKKTKVERAKEFLKEHLSEGKRHATDVILAAKEYGNIGETNLRKAFHDIGGKFENDERGNAELATELKPGGCRALRQAGGDGAGPGA